MSKQNNQFTYTIAGCTAARSYLKMKAITFPAGLTGWEIVKMANDAIAGSDESRCTCGKQPDNSTLLPPINLSAPVKEK